MLTWKQFLESKIMRENDDDDDWGFGPSNKPDQGQMLRQQLQDKWRNLPAFLNSNLQASVKLVGNTPKFASPTMPPAVSQKLQELLADIEKFKKESMGYGVWNSYDRYFEQTLREIVSNNSGQGLNMVADLITHWLNRPLNQE